MENGTQTWVTRSVAIWNCRQNLSDFAGGLKSPYVNRALNKCRLFFHQNNYLFLLKDLCCVATGQECALPKPHCTCTPKAWHPSGHITIRNQATLHMCSLSMTPEREHNKDPGYNVHERGPARECTLGWLFGDPKGNGVMLVGWNYLHLACKSQLSCIMLISMCSCLID